MSYLAFSRRWAGYLAGRTGLPPEKEAVLAYVIEVLVINLANVALAVALGALLGVLPGTLACLVTVALFRQTAGGAHSSSPWRCGVVTVASLPALALLARAVAPLGRPYTDILMAAVLVTGLVAILHLAPVDNPAAPIISPARRKRLKFLALAVFALVAVTAVALGYSAWPLAAEIRACLLLSLLWVSFLLSGPGHRVMQLIDGLAIKPVKGG